MLESKVFANGSTTLPKPVRDALGVKAGDRVRYVISEKGVHIELAQSVPGNTMSCLRRSESVLNCRKMIVYT